MFNRDLINPMLTGEQLIEALRILPKYDDTMRDRDKSTRLVALSDLYNIYLPSVMSEEIYSKLYLSLLRSLNKKETINAVRQANENFKAVKRMSYQGIIGGSDSFTIIGCSGIGKSSAISRAVDLITYKPFVEFNQTKICPIVVVQCPFDSSVKGLAFEILRNIDDVLETKYYSNALRSHATTDVLIGIISQVSLYHIGLLIIDEIQNVASSKNGRTFINAITQLINNSGVSICMVGTPECKVFFEQQLQLARRSMGLEYTPLQYDYYFENFCRTVFRFQYTRYQTELEAGILEWLYEYSGGLVSLVVSLLHDAQEIAIITGSESLNLASLNEAFQKRTAMLHGYLERYIIKLPVTTKAKSTTEQLIPTTKQVLLNNNFSFVEVVEQAKKSRYDVVEVLKQYITIEEIGKEGCKKC